MLMFEYIGIFYIVVAFYMFVIASLSATGWHILMFKVVPLLIGIASIIYALQHYGFVIRPEL